MLTSVLQSFLLVIPTALAVTAAIAVKKNLSGNSPKRASRVNFVTFAALAVLVAVLSVGVFAENAPENVNSAETAQTEQTQSENSDSGMSKGLGLLAAALVTGLAGIGGGLAVAAGAPAAIAATSEDPKSFGKSIIFVALGESIALYGVVISILILQKV